MSRLKRLIAITVNRGLISLALLLLPCFTTPLINAAIYAAERDEENANQAISVVDDGGNVLHLERPASRIVSLAPHVTELVFAAGAGDRLVGVVAYSDYPVDALTIPVIGDSSNMDLERIIELKPDLVIGWQSGNPARVIDKLRSLQLPVYLSEPGGFDSIARTLKNIGQLGGEPSTAIEVGDELMRRIDALAEKYLQAETVSVFHPIWSDPLMTLGGEHIFSSILKLCGGENIFNDLGQIAAEVSIESVHQRDPDIILGSDQKIDAEAHDRLREHWRSWPSLTAVKNNHIYIVQSDLVHRPTPRVADGAESVCAILDDVRKRL